jgi:hypothetical protein
MRDGRPVGHHLVRLLAALAMTGLLLGPSARAATGPVRAVTPAFTPVPGHDSSEWLMMGPHCGASLS